MTEFLVTVVKPLLQEGQHPMLRARACALIQSYSYLDFPQDQPVEFAAAIYSCLTSEVADSSLASILRVSACHAFNSLLKYEAIVSFVVPNVKNILGIYTSLLEADGSVIRNLEGLLGELEGALKPFADDLVDLLLGKFGQSFQFSKHPPNSPSNCFSQGASREEENEEEDEEDEENEVDNDYEAVAKACMASIRQIMQAQEVNLSQ